MASLADGHVTHRMLQEVYAPESSTDGDVLAMPVADAIGNHVLRFDPDSLTYSFVHALLREAVEAAVQPADRLDWHRRWAEVLSRQAPSDRDLSLQVAAAHHWAQAGADIEAFDAAIAAGQASYRIGAYAEVGRLFARALRLWDRVPDPAGRADVTRDQVLIDAVMSVAETMEPEAALALIDAELARERFGEGDRTRTLCLRLARAMLAEMLRQPHDDSVDTEGLESMDALMSMDATPLQIVALIRLGSSVWHTDPKRAHRIYRQALLTAQELGDLRRQRWAGSTMATHLGCQGRVEAALATCEMLIRDATDSTVSLMDMDAERGFSLNHAGRYREARAAIEHALSRVSDPLLCQHLWARAETYLCMVLFALGEWDKEKSHLERLWELPPLPGDQRVILARIAVQWACHRGDEQAAQHWVDLAQANLPPDDGALYLDTWVDVSWLTAETALARGNLISAREALTPLWDVPGYEMYWEAWQPVLLAARIEADLSDQASSGTGPSAAVDGKDAIAAIRAVGAKLPLYGDLGVAREAHLNAELARANRMDEPAHWAQVVEAWTKVGHVPNRAWAQLRLGAAHVQAGNRHEAVEPLSESLRIASKLGWTQVRDSVADLARRSRLRLGTAVAAQRAHGTSRLRRLKRLTDRELEVLRLIAQGMSNDEIGATLFISPRTASVHVSRILAKLEVTTRAKATAVAYDEGLFAEGASADAHRA
jgi:DNA-binding CsgD family transcriptional regulator